jgi:hypothetical protein
MIDKFLSYKVKSASHGIKKAMQLQTLMTTQPRACACAKVLLMETGLHHIAAASIAMVT